MYSTRKSLRWFLHWRQIKLASAQKQLNFVPNRIHPFIILYLLPGFGYAADWYTLNYNYSNIFIPFKNDRCPPRVSIAFVNRLHNCHEISLHRVGSLLRYDISLFYPYPYDRLMPPILQLSIFLSSLYFIPSHKTK